MRGGHVLGVSCGFHDAAAALVSDGRVVAAAEEERFSRRRHDASMPLAAIASCLASAGLGPDDLDAVVLHERPLAALGRFMATKRRQGPTGIASFVRDAPTLVGRNLLAGYHLERGLRALGARRIPDIRYGEHHRSHAAAAFFPSPFDHAAVLTIDGIGEWTTASVALGTGERIEILEEMRFPDSLGLLYSLVTVWCGFSANHGEAKVMGLAPYGTPRFRPQLDALARLGADGSLRVDARRVSWFGQGAFRDRRLRRMFDGPPRRPDEEITQREADLAASVQQFTEDAVLRLAAHARRRTGASAVCLAGGVALNCVANGRLSRAGIFDDIWIQPAAGDSGSAIGAALSHAHEEMGVPRVPATPDGMSGAFLGPRAHDDEIDLWLRREHITAERFDDTQQLLDRVAEELAGGAVVGWFRGRMEFGPRALGHRSILADPRSTTVRNRINSSVKLREDFRPLAPAVQAEHAHEWFDLDVESPYMLLVAQVRDEHLLHVAHEPTSIAERAEVPRSTIPACTHVDGSARVQTVDARTDPAFHGLLDSFRRLTGCPVLVNTSFNTAGEPMVADPDEAWRTAVRSGLDLLVIDDVLIPLAARRTGSADDDADDDAAVA